MFLSNSSIRRPVAMGCLVIALFLLGANSYRKLGLENLPKLDIPYISVTTVYPGASPREIETDVARKIEDAVSSIDGLKHVSSTCMENVVQTVLEFELGMNVDEVANDVRAKIDLIINDLPSTAEKPKVLKFDINAQPIINLALTGDVPIEQLYDFADNKLSDRLSGIRGVAEVQLIGGAELEVQVRLDREKLAGHGFTSVDVIQAIQSGIQTVPSGRIRQNGSEYSVKFDAEYKNVKSIGSLEIANNNGSRFYLKDLGSVVMTSEEQRQAAFINGKPCIAVRVVKKSDANAVALVGKVREAVDNIQDILPGGMELIWVTDDGAFIQSSVESAIGSIIQGVLLTALILFFFLYDFRATVIVGISMPVTIIISLFFLNMLGFTLNTSTLLAVGLSVGVLVTNSIVVLESITSRASVEGDMKKAARIGASEVATAVLASAGTNVVVLFPVAMMGTVVGMYLRPFALTTVVVTIVSLFISFTLTPILCSVLLKPRLAASTSLTGRMEVLWNKILGAASNVYAGSLKQIMGRRLVALCVTVAAFAVLILSMQSAGGLGFSLMPDNDTGIIYIKLEYPTRYNLEHTIVRVHEVEELLKEVPGLVYTYSTIGKVEGALSASEGVYLGQVLLKLTDMSERSENIEELQAHVRDKLKDYPECIISVGIPSGAGGQEMPIRLELVGDDLNELDKLALEAKEVALAVKGVVDPDTSVRIGKHELRIKPKRAVLSDRNLPVEVVGYTLRANLEGIKAGVFKKGSRTFDIRVKLDEKEGKEQVDSFMFPGEAGRPVMLTSLADVEEVISPIQINRKDKQRIAMLQANLDGSSPMGTAVADMTKKLKENLNMPPGYDFAFTGQYEVMGEAIVEFAEAGLTAMLLTYLLLAAILESFTRPFIILVTLPLALIGVMGALLLTGKSISMYVMLGMVMLIGIVVNNAILIMDRLKVHTDAGLAPGEAMIKAATDQFRPILMITMAAILGMLPLALGQGLGSESRQGIGIASVGGIAISSLLTFFVLPAIFSLFSRKKLKEDAK